MPVPDRLNITVSSFSISIGRKAVSGASILGTLNGYSVEQKTSYVLDLIEHHPEGKLVLPNHDGLRADLRGINLSCDNPVIRSRLLRYPRGAPPVWWEPPGHVVLRHADLKGADLRKANLQGVDLEGAVLEDSDLRNANLKDAFLQRTNFKNANLYKVDLCGLTLNYADLRHSKMPHAKLKEAKLSHAKLCGAWLIGCQLQGANLDGADLRRTKLRNANLEGANLRRARLEGADLSEAETLRHAFLSETWLDRTRIGKDQFDDMIGEEAAASRRDSGQIKRNEYRAESYRQAKLGYLGLKQNFEALGDYEAASWAYCKERRMEKQQAFYRAKVCLGKREWKCAARNLMKYLSDQIVQKLCNYGESFQRVMLFMIVILVILGPAMIRGLGGLDWPKHNEEVYLRLPLLAQQWLYAYAEYFMYTLDTFTTANVASLKPDNEKVRLVSSVMALVGIFLTGLLGFVAGNRIRRS